MDVGYFLEAAIGIGCCALVVVYLAVSLRYPTMRWSFVRFLALAYLESRDLLPYHDPLPYEAVAARVRTDPAYNLFDGVRDLLLAHQKLETVKLYRTMTDASLQEAKAEVDAAERDLRDSQAK
jgi:hypothetical protein